MMSTDSVTLEVALLSGLAIEIEVLCCRHMFWLKKMGKVPKVTLYALSFKPNPPNSAK